MSTQDTRTTKEALAGLFDTDMLMSDEFSGSPAASAAPAASPLQLPTSVIDQMDERHGKFSNRLSLFGHLYGGGDKSTFGDEDIRNQHKLDTKAYNAKKAQGLLASQFADLDMDNLSMADVATITQLDAGLGGQALENFQFGQRVGDLGRAQGFLDDGVEDENDLWARETFGRYGKTAGGQNTTLTNTLQKAGYTEEQFDGLSTEAQESILYQHGSDADRAAMDRVAGRKTPEQIQQEERAKQEGSASGQQMAADRKSLISVRGQVEAQNQGVAKLTEIREGLADDDASTGWPRIVRDFLNANTREDGQMDEATATGVIDLISQATFGALSQSELDLLKGGLMDPTKSSEYNIGTLDKAIQRIQNEQSILIKDAQKSADRYKEEGDYDQLMEDDWMFQNVGAGSKIKPIPAFGDNEEHTFNQYVEEMNANLGPFDQKPTRDELVAGFAEERKAAEEDYRAQEAKRAQLEKAANASWDYLTQPFAGSTQ